MPAECLLLEGAALAYEYCPDCGCYPFEPFLRGEVQRSKRTLFSWPPFKLRPYCAVICRACKNIVGHEMPEGEMTDLGQVIQRETFNPNAVRVLLEAVAEEYKISPDLDTLEVAVLRAAARVRASEANPTDETRPILGLWR